MNKPRPTALPLKKAVRVSPPTAPGGFFSFQSFRVKKNSKASDSPHTEISARRRAASGDCEQLSSTEPWASAVVSPIASRNTFNGSSDNGRVSTFKTFHADSAPCSPCTGSDYRFVKDSTKFYPICQTDFGESSETQRSYADQGRGSGSYTTGTISEMHTGYYDKKVSQKSISDDIPAKPPTGILRHQTLRSNSEPHGHAYFGGGTDISGGPSHGGFSNVYGNNYHTVLEDQGIDMSQSPGHESPSSTVSSNTVSVSGGSGVSSSVGSAGTGHSRHSAASFDSGRASSSLYQQGVRYSGLSSESSSTGSCRHSYHSSSSSLGSIPPEEICNFDVSSMIAQGLPDPEILNAWLTGVHFEFYYQNFIQAGYDMQTIVKMTPEDLNAIGITKPNHRKRLKSEISQLIIPDGLPDYIPSTIEEWLRVLRMDEYTEKLKAQGYSNVRQVTNITWEDLEDIGILKLGHQKKFLLAIKRIEDILSGKRIHMGGGGSGTQNPYHPNMDCYAVPHRLLQTNANASQMPYSQHNPNQSSQVHGPSSVAARAYISSFQKGFAPQQQQPAPPFSTWRQNSLDKEHSSYHHEESLYGANDKPHLQLLTHQPQIHPEKPPPPATNGLGQPEYHPEVIAIHVKSDRRPSTIADHCGEPIYGTSSFQAPPNPASVRSGLQGKWMDDGETTPTNEADIRTACTTSHLVESSSGTSTLPRLMKNKALGKTVGHDVKVNMGNHKDHPIGLDITYQNECPPTQSQWPQQKGVSMDGYKSLPKNMGRFQSTFGMPRNCNPSVNAGGIGRQPPPPPRRSSSTTQESRQETFSTFHPTPSTSGSALRQHNEWSNSGDDNDLPAPPPPEDLALITGSGSSASSENASVPISTSQNNHSLNNTTSSTSLTACGNANGNTNANAAFLSTTNTNLSDYHHQHHNAYASNSSTNPVAYSSSRIHPSTSTVNNRLRDPSPGSSDTDVGTTFSTVGVRRNGSDASFKSSSSTESESLPFANDNAGTIKQQKPGNRAVQGGTLDSIYGSTPGSSTNPGDHLEAGDVLSDIGNMLADLTDELDAILQQEMDSSWKK